MKQATTILRDNADIIYAFKIENTDDRRDFRKTFCGALSDEFFSQLIQSGWDKPYGFVKVDRKDPLKTKYFSKSEELSPEQESSII